MIELLKLDNVKPFTRYVVQTYTPRILCVLWFYVTVSCHRLTEIYYTETMIVVLNKYNNLSRYSDGSQPESDSQFSAQLCNE